MAASYGWRYVQIASDLPEADWSGLGSFAMSDLGETLTRTIAWAYTVAQRFAGSAHDLSASSTERDRLAARVQELERELDETKSRLEKALAKISGSSKRKKKAVVKAMMLQERVTSLEGELQGAKATTDASQERVASLEAELEVAKATVVASQERVASLEADRVAIEYRSIERTLYGVWRQDPNFDFSSFGEHAVARAAEWNAQGRRP
ncbi:uncharacterized protein LOC133804588 [Humulus lupulus]|uniref:uncharacterized protein LOC133804588 n=1 Tax=Humulus lupulus TaxID=3486 RepID=UPI002B408510|nr:uncharacterized protein LOC133804588 [Humulus lupulus]